MVEFVASALLAISAGLLGFSLGIQYVVRRFKRDADDAAAAWERIAATYRVDPLMQSVRYPPAHKRLIN